MLKSHGGTRRVVTAGAVMAALALAMPPGAVSPLSQATPPAVDEFTATAAGPAGRSIESSDPPARALEGYTAARAAEPVQAAEASKPTISSPGDATPVRLTDNHIACGAGLTAMEFMGEDPFGLCTHTYADPAPTRSPKAGVARVAPICHGDGISGPRIQLVYMHLENQPNRATEWVPRIMADWVPAMEGSFRTTSADQGREIGMRLHMPNCEVQVTTLSIDPDEGAADDGQFPRIVNRVRESLNPTDRKFHVWFDGPSAGPCGIAQALLFPVAGDNPTPANAHNFGYGESLVPQVAVSFKLPFDFPNWPGTAPVCWGNGAMGAHTEVHEVLHTLGAVNTSSPNSNGLGHCRDALDIMCYAEGGVELFDRCSTGVELLDCGSDDYFNARPPVGSYLSTHWNTANSRYLGPAPEDNVPTEIPRP